MKELNIVSMSGGKDSTASLLVAIEQGAENLMGVFADTGNEHPETYEFVRYLERETGVPIQWVRTSFAERINAKRERLESGNHDWPEDLARQAIEILQPTGNQFLDLCLWKGRFPSRMAQFCTQELKVNPIHEEVIEPAIGHYDRIVSWQGVRANESKKRSTLPQWDMEFGDPETGKGLWNYRPILNWTAEDVFAMHRRMGIRWNPLYEQGMGRVGCMPCINVNKDELAKIANRFPEQIDRIERWEELVSKAAKRGCATFFAIKGEDDVSLEKHGVRNQVAWSRTTRGGKQYDLIKMSEEGSGCQSVYGLCE